MKITTAEWASDQCRTFYPLASQYNQALHSSSVFKVGRWKLWRVPCQFLFGHSRSPSIQPFQWGLLHKHHRPMHRGKQYHEGKENTIHHRCSGILKTWIAKQIAYRWQISQLTHYADPLYSGPEDMLGLVFAKRGTYMNHKESYCNDYYRSLSNPGECCWWDCQLPTSIGSPSQYTQMTTAIFVR